MEKDLEGLKEAPQLTQRNTKKKYQTRKRLTMTAYMETGFKNSLPSMRDLLSK